MPVAEASALIIAGAVLGVLGVLVTLFALVGKVDARYILRTEYQGTLEGIQRELSEIKSDLRAHVNREDPR